MASTPLARARPVTTLFRVRLSPIAGVAAAAVILAACGHSTSPPPASYSEARHLDSLAIQAAGEQADGLNSYLTFAVAVLGEGVSPATISVTEDGTAESYQAVALEIVETTAGSSPTPSDSLFVMTAWTSPNAASLLSLMLFAPDTIAGVADTEDTTSNSNIANTPTLTATVGTFSQTGKCRPLSSLQTASYLIDGTTCTSGTISGSFQFGVTADAPAPAHTFVLGTTTLPAVRIVLPVGDGGTQRVRINRLYH
jgi:hypothetical protein